MLRLKPIVVYFVITFLHVTSTYAERLLPPEIQNPQGNQWPKSVIVKRASEEQKIMCEASGNPTPTYVWTKNGETVQTIENRITFDSVTGDLILETQFEEADNGLYQCTAYNSQGSSMTPFLKIELAKALPFPGSNNDDVSEEITEFLYQKIVCQDVPISIPAHEFQWVRGQVNGAQEPIVPNDRIVLDPKGNLHILWVNKTEDENTYQCGYRNDVIKVDMWNTKNVKLTVTDSTLPNPNRAPVLKFHEDVTVMAGTDAVLTCIFSYYSTNSSHKLMVTWVKGGVVKQRSTSFTYTIKNVPYPTAQRDDSGQYICQADLPGYDTSTDGFVSLKIIAPPQFLKGHSLERLAIPKGGDAVFRCKTDTVYAKSYSQPTAWLVNSQPVVGCLPTKFQCSRTHTNGSSVCLSMSNRCNSYNDCPGTEDSDYNDEQNCPNGCGDGTIFCNGQCVASNATCQEIVCDYPSFLCRNGQSCLNQSQRCNNNEECTDASDEDACPAPVDFLIGRYIFSSDRSVMTLRNVSLSDNLCVQCTVTNEFGSSFSDGCLTVIDKIYVNPKPNASYDVSPGMYLNIGVDATTDSAYASQIDFVWYMYDLVMDEETEEISEVKLKLPAEGLENYFSTSSTEKNLTIAIPGTSGSTEFADADEYNLYKRLTYNKVYSLVVEHPYDRVEFNFTLNGEKISPPVVVPTTAQAGSNLWLIAVILGIIVLIALVIFIICMVCRRDPRGAYYVDKKEHEAGNDPEQELKDSGFHDVGRVEDDDMDDKPEMEKISLSESVNQYESDDDITEEYGGDFDMSSKFNEDGSFIGIYGDKKNKSRGTKEATV